MKKRKLVLLGLDGADWKILNPLIGEGCLPNFKRVMENGSYARLSSTIPPLTPPAWTSIFTGVNPGKHGIFDFFYIVKGEKKFTTALDVNAPYVWEFMGKEKIIAFNMPFCYPPPKSENIIMISGFGTPSPLSSYTYPKEVKREILKKIPDYEVSLKIQREPLDEDTLLNKKNFSEFVKKNLRCKKETAVYLLENKEWDAAFIVFSATDWIQHFFMHEFFEAERKCSTDIAAVYKSIDEFLGYLIEKKYNILLVSDHGFSEVKKKCYVNTYLKQKGLLKIRKLPLTKNVLRRIGISKEFFMHTWPFSYIAGMMMGSGIARIGGRFLPTEKPKTEDIDCEESIAFLASSNGAVEIKSDEHAEYVKRVLLDCKDADEKAVFRDVSHRNEIYKGKFLDKSPGIIVMPRADIVLKETITDKIFEEIDVKTGKTGSHDYYGIFASYGPDIEKKGELPDLPVVDIAPTILSYFGYSTPESIDGKKIELFECPLDLKSTLKHRTKASIRKILRRENQESKP